MILGPAPHEPHGVVPVGEVGEAYGIVAMSAQVTHQHLVLGPRASVRLGPDTKLGTRSVVGDDTVVNAKASRSPGGSRRQAGRTGAVVVLETRSFASDGIDGGRSRPAVAVTAQVIRPQAVDVKQDDSQSSPP